MFDKILLTTAFVSLGMLLRSSISLHPYSGEAQPPMFGDFEAQRHWQEITVNLPVQDWYNHTKDNDLQYWGLDYPPLTAYHSFWNGKVAKYLNESFVELHTSRGITTEQHKLFMRTTVIVVDLVLYIPALLLCCYATYEKFWKSHKLTRQHFLCLHAIVLLFFPGQILIDNGHFQYNNFSLGFAAIAIACILFDETLAGAHFFVYALNYKQMELYHALPFFFFLLGNCFKKSKSLMGGVKNLLLLGFVVVATFALIWLPWLSSPASVLQIINRIFPVARGVFEDKVSNVWCIANIFIKIKEKFTNEQMAIVCLTSTLAVVLPSSMHLLSKTKKNTFLLALINSSLGFFLFSFQVHEKSILLAALPVAIYFPLDPFPCLWFLQIATFSMLPLLIKDGLLLAYIGLSVFYLAITRVYLEMTETDQSQGKRMWLDVCFIESLLSRTTSQKKPTNRLFIYLFYLSLFGAIALIIMSTMFAPPPHLPYLFPLLVSAYSCAHFVSFFLYFNIKQFL